MIAYGEFRRLFLAEAGARQKRGSPLLFIAAVLALLFVAIGPFSTTIAQFDMLCNENAGLEVSEDLDNLNVEENTACYVTKAAPHILQAFNATVTCVLLELFLKISASLKMRRFDGGGPWSTAVNVITIFVIPTVCMIVM